jgi:hypothetical protein
MYNNPDLRRAKLMYVDEFQPQLRMTENVPWPGLGPAATSFPTNLRPPAENACCRL